jgi:aryl-alcohol dehydrogenase-like predicted oxidoreductase
MNIRRLGTTGLLVSPIGLGTAAIGGGGYAWGWGPQDDRDSIAAIRAAVESGINWIDTASAYGLGHSEEIIARATEALSPRPYVFTKCGMAWNDRREIWHCLKKDSIRNEVEASLRRLRRDVIDLCQIHWPRPDADIEEACGVLVQLQSEGKLRFIGVSNFDIVQMRRAQSVAAIATLQAPYSLMDRRVEDAILPFAVERGIGVISYSPMKSGLLSGTMTRERIKNLPSDDHRADSQDFSEPRLSRNLAVAHFLCQLGARYGRSAGEMAIAWVLKNQDLTGAIVGARSAAQIAGIVSAVNIRFDPEDLKALDDFMARMRPGLIERGVNKARSFIRRLVYR